MNFDLSQDDELLLEGVRQFCAREVVPHAGAWDQARAIPQAVYGQLAELGLLGLEAPEALGGVGLSVVAASAVVMELARASCALALSVSTHNALVVRHLLRAGSPEQRARWVPALAAGERLGAWAASEPGAGSDMAAMATTATRDGDGWVLRGRKALVTHGARAGLYVILARVEGAPAGQAITAFVVEGGAPGLVAHRVPTLGVRACDVADLELDGVRVGDDARLGDVGAARGHAHGLLDRGRVNVAAMGVGLLRAALAAARDYSMEREQFGQPIARFQAIQWKLADMATQADAAWLLALRAAALCDAGDPGARQAAARAKRFAAQAAVTGCSDALQIHGGYGYTREYPVERYLRDARLCAVGQGTAEMMGLIVARDIARRFGT